MKQEKKQIEICDSTLIGKWEDVTNKELSTITHNENDTEKLDGMLIYGYETKFGKTNTNAEQYEKTAIDEFIQEYFVNQKLNMPVDVEHDGRPEWLVGRVVYAESNNTGFYFVVYVSRTHEKYDILKQRIEEGLIQGLSKYGMSTDCQWVEDEGELFGGHLLIKKCRIYRMSLVSTPANGVTFERVKEIKNTLRFVSNHEEEEVTPQPKKKKSMFK